uniref:Lipoxygenase domain-containing protein n=1 Tax=Chenopodium quinoa TaxID=63459 RepID=A0A803LPZ0_CHEQI
MYVPRDEQFGESKKMALEMRQTKGRVRNVIPQLLRMISEESGDTFEGYLDINSLYKQHLKSQDLSRGKPSLPLLFKALKNSKELLDDNFKFDPPKAIPTHRQLSVMHPIYKLLDPNMKYTLQVNAMARETLIYAGGIIDNDFTSGKYSMLLPCAAYREWWRFDLGALPSDLIRRGVAISDPNQPHGLRLLIEDYPYANDGLLIWSAIEELVKTYVKYYYTNAAQIQSDIELQSWYNESINVGHEDLRHANWWPKLNTLDDLSSILTILIWLASAQHAALNFRQYPSYGGYIPMRPPLMRRLVPHQYYDPVEYKDFVANPQANFLASLPSLAQATRCDPEIVEAFYKFSMQMKRIERVIEERNGDMNLRNRCGAGVTPYELFVPSSGPGVTSKGVPNSITL